MCSKPVAPRPDNKAFPFCSERCRMADLGRWLNEDYRIPVVDNDSDAAAAAVDDEEEK
jgi:endogenous inhibitor of DNA gyrase (YacG/DUF329 family)